jgi:hypothetical protein
MLTNASALPIDPVQLKHFSAMSTQHRKLRDGLEFNDDDEVTTLALPAPQRGPHQDGGAHAL